MLRSATWLFDICALQEFAAWLCQGQSHTLLPSSELCSNTWEDVPDTYLVLTGSVTPVIDDHSTLLRPRHCHSKSRYTLKRRVPWFGAFIILPQPEEEGYSGDPT